MSDGLATFVPMHRTLIRVMGESCSVQQGAVILPDVRMRVDDSVQDVGQFAQVVAGKRVVQVLLEDVVLQRGDLVTARGSSRRVEAILQNDGIAMTAVLHG